MTMKKSFQLHTGSRALAAVAACWLAVNSALSFAAECTAASGGQRVAVLELYTSEGCDSCPPADKWVTQLPANNLGAARVIPLAFHVDYWNQLGWTDRFSQAVFSERQRRHSNRRGVTFVVTPQLLLNGQDYRSWNSFGDFAAKVKAINESKPLAAIHVTSALTGSVLASSVEASITAGTAQKDADVYLALFENNLVTQVDGGENRGHTLRHDFVVRKLVGPLPLDDNGKFAQRTRFELMPQWKPQDVSLAVFVQDRRTGDVLQAVAAHCS
jgi:hypothetical protein